MVLLLKANYKQTQWRGQTIHPGQLVTGRKQLSEWTGLSEQQIRTFLKRLKSTSNLTIKTTNKYSIITITNWEKYQETEENQPATQPTNNQQITTSKKLRKKEVKNNNTSNDIFNFEALYNKYPRKLGKKKGLEICRKKIKSKEQYENLSKAIDNYSKINYAQNEKYIKHFSTFMNSWEDYITTETEDLSEGGIFENWN